MVITGTVNVAALYFNRCLIWMRCLSIWGRYVVANYWVSMPVRIGSIFRGAGKNKRYFLGGCIVF